MDKMTDQPRIYEVVEDGFVAHRNGSPVRFTRNEVVGELLAAKTSNPHEPIYAIDSATGLVVATTKVIRNDGQIVRILVEWQVS